MSDTWLCDNIIHCTQLLLICQGDGRIGRFNNPLLLLNKNLPSSELLIVFVDYSGTSVLYTLLYLLFAMEAVEEPQNSSLGTP